MFVVRSEERKICTATNPCVYIIPNKISQKKHGPEEIKKCKPKKLVKLNKSISRKKIVIFSIRTKKFTIRLWRISKKFREISQIFGLHFFKVYYSQ